MFWFNQNGWLSSCRPLAAFRKEIILRKIKNVQMETEVKEKQGIKEADQRKKLKGII